MPATKRAWWPWLLIVAYAVQVGSILYGVAWHIDRPLGGFVPQVGGPSELHIYAAPTTLEAERFRAGRSLELVAVNGHSVCETPAGPRCGFDWVYSHIDTAAGAKNEFVVRAPPDETEHTVTLSSGVGDASAVLGWAVYGLAIAGLGAVYAVIGLLVWRRRPDDPAALPFLLFSLATASTLGSPVLVDELTRWVRALTAPSAALLMPLLFLFAHSFAFQTDASKTWRFRGQLFFATAVALLQLVLLVLTSSGVFALRPWLPIISPLLVIGAVVALALTLYSTWRAARRPSPLTHRRRARVLGLAVLLGFGYPTLWLILRDWLFQAGYDQAAFWGLLLAFGSFPILIGYAMVRLRMFDLRIVMRQGLVYTVLSLILALAYVGIVFGAYQLAGVRRSATVSAIAAVVVALLFGVLRVRLERWIDAMVFRSRAVFEKAIELSGKALSQARHPAEVAPALRYALVDALGLSRAYIAELTADGERAHCHEVGSTDTTSSSDDPTQPLPSLLRLSSSACLTHCFDRAEVVQSVDPTVPLEEGGISFWEQHGIEASVPFGSGDDAPAGLLLLGPKRSGRPLDPEDIVLVGALGNQVALALSSSRAFERVAASGKALLTMTQGIVHETNTPLGVLKSSLDTLELAVSKLAQAEDEKRKKRALEGSHASIATARQSGDRMKALIADLEAFVNLEETERAAVDLGAILSEVVREAKEASGHAIELDAADEVATVDGYPTKLRHVLRGIIDNAIVATQDNTPVSVSLSHDAAQWRITVRDEGTGMSEEILDNVFELGLAAKRAEKRMGLRLGLPYAKRVVEELGGRIGITSQLGEGTEVRIALPALRRE